MAGSSYNHLESDFLVKVVSSSVAIIDLLSEKAR